MAAVMAQNANKRKRDVQDIPNVRSATSIGPHATEISNQFLEDMSNENQDPSLDFSTALAHSNNSTAASVNERIRSRLQDRAGGNDTNQHTASAALAFTMTIPEPTEKTFIGHDPETGETLNQPGHGVPLGPEHDFSQLQQGDPSAAGMGQGGAKPAVGTEEWQRQRKDNHKEVERRRRETINEGINELAKIVPDCEKNKGSILARAVQFIQQLKNNEEDNINRWSMEKLLTEQAIAELSETCDKLKSECHRAWRELEAWKKAAQKAGVTHVEIEDKDKTAEQA